MYSSAPEVSLARKDAGDFGGDELAEHLNEHTYRQYEDTYTFTAPGCGQLWRR